MPIGGQSPRQSARTPPDAEPRRARSARTSPTAGPIPRRRPVLEDSSPQGRPGRAAPRYRWSDSCRPNAGSAPARRVPPRGEPLTPAHGPPSHRQRVPYSTASPRARSPRHAGSPAPWCRARAAMTARLPCGRIWVFARGRGRTGPPPCPGVCPPQPLRSCRPSPAGTAHGGRPRSYCRSIGSRTRRDRTTGRRNPQARSYR